MAPSTSAVKALGRPLHTELLPLTPTVASMVSNLSLISTIYNHSAVGAYRWQVGRQNISALYSMS